MDNSTYRKKAVVKICQLENERSKGTIHLGIKKTFNLTVEDPERSGRMEAYNSLDLNLILLT